MKKLLTTDNKDRLQLIMRVIAITALLFAVFMTSYYSWFYFWRKTAAVAKVSDPTAIFINAGNQEDIRYLNLADLDLETADTNHTNYKDYVFCVRGSVQFYKLQLAYTTNNQFNYEIYPAAEFTSGELPNNATASVTWTVHTGDDAGTQKTYYSTSSYIEGTILNKETNAANLDLTDEILAKTDDSYYTATYGTYVNRHKYAVPLYWQSNNAIHVEDIDSEGNFCHYFILRIKWDNSTANRTNNKETDIIYISAKNITSNNG